MMEFKVFADAEAVARAAAEWIAREARSAVTDRGRFVMAVSGGRTPWQMLRLLADHDLPWDAVHVAQVDERIAPPGHPDRNLTHLRQRLLEHASLSEQQIHPMPVDSFELEAAATNYARELAEIAGSPPILDLVHLGLGPDGHTASLVPGDPVLDVTDVDVGVTGVYQGRRRMTMTYPLLNRARRVLWIIIGADKREMLARLRSGDRTIPAGRVNRDRAVVLADRSAASSSDNTE